jgi:hypothetical protein
MARGEHLRAYNECKPFPETAKLSLISAVNPWRPGSAGGKFHAVLTAVCANGATTVQSVIEAGKVAGFEANEAMDHIRWLYTWGGGYLSVDGLVYPAMPEQVDQKPKAA